MRSTFQITIVLIIMLLTNFNNNLKYCSLTCLMADNLYFIVVILKNYAQVSEIILLLFLEKLNFVFTIINVDTIIMQCKNNGRFL